MGLQISMVQLLGMAFSMFNNQGPEETKKKLRLYLSQMIVLYTQPRKPRDNGGSCFKCRKTRHQAQDYTKPLPGP